MLTALGHLLIIDWLCLLTSQIKALFIKSDNYWKRFKAEPISLT